MRDQIGLIFVTNKKGFYETVLLGHYTNVTLMYGKNEMERSQCRCKGHKKPAEFNACNFFNSKIWWL